MMLRAEAGHAGGPAEDAGGHRQRRRWEPRRGRARAAGRRPAGARRAVPAAPGAQVTGAPVDEMYTRRACAFAARGGVNKNEMKLPSRRRLHQIAMA